MENQIAHMRRVIRPHPGQKIFAVQAIFLLLQIKLLFLSLVAEMDITCQFHTEQLWLSIWLEL